VAVGKEGVEFKKVLCDSEQNLAKNGKGGTSSNYVAGQKPDSLIGSIA
jgi:hypothetical protein